MRTIVYVDGLNLYSGCLKGTPFKWLDLAALCSRLLPGHDIRAIKYFTTRVDNRMGDPHKSTRQDTYFRALRTLPSIQIILGQFLTHPVHLPKADGTGLVRVLRTEEKGSDVNLATHLVHDAHRGVMDCAAVFSNDSDLAEPMRIVNREIRLPIGLITPTLRKNRHPSRQLLTHADFVKQVRRGVLAVSQLPDPVLDSRGSIQKPSSW